MFPLPLRKLRLSEGWAHRHCQLPVKTISRFWHRMMREKPCKLRREHVCQMSQGCSWAGAPRNDRVCNHPTNAKSSVRGEPVCRGREAGAGRRRQCCRQWSGFGKNRLLADVQASLYLGERCSATQTRKQRTSRSQE